jgi:hypothetical protein
MTDTDPTPNPALNTDACEAKAREQAGLSESIHAADKVALFDALARASITIVTVRFDGSGDDGQIAEIQAQAGDAPVELPAGEIEFQAICGSAEPRRSTLDISGAIENLVYDFLEDTHSGWGNNDGAYGDFTFDVAERTITLDYYERVMESEYFQHEF